MKDKELKLEEAKAPHALGFCKNKPSSKEFLFKLIRKAAKKSGQYGTSGLVYEI
jgi:hypothetical protein